MGHLVDTCTHGHEFQIIYSGRKGDLNFILKCMPLSCNLAAVGYSAVSVKCFTLRHDFS